MKTRIRLILVAGLVTAGVLAALSMGWLGCRRPGNSGAGSPAGAEAPWFVDATDELGLKFVHDPGPFRNFFMPQIVGSGVALFDFDNDGLLDVYCVQNAGLGSAAKNRLFHQEPDGRFTDVSEGSGLDVAGYGMGVAVGDVNNDGLPDVIVTEYRGVRLFLNLGMGKFREVTRQAGLDNPLWGTSAAFVDYDRDGWLDLVIVNYVDYEPTVSCTNPAGRKDYCAPKNFSGSVTKLFRNRGAEGVGPDGPRFEDVTLKSGLAALAGPGLGVLCADFNGDGWPDIFVANDGKANALWINQRNGTFREEATLRGLAYNRMGQAEANMGVAIGDVNNDGLFDLFVSHLVIENHTFWRQGPRGSFSDETVGVGLTRSPYRGTGFGTVLGDFDNDGWLDLAVANGAVVQDRPPVEGGTFLDQYLQRNQLYANDGKGGFADLSASNAPFCGTPAVSRGLAWGSLRNDGRMDLVVTTVGGPARIYRNVVPNPGHWLLVRALDPARKRDAYGAEVTVTAGGHTWWRQINPGVSYLTSGDPRAHFGLGQTGRVEEIRVRWPDGSLEVFPGGDADRLITLEMGKGRKAS